MMSSKTNNIVIGPRLNPLVIANSATFGPSFAFSPVLPSVPSHTADVDEWLKYINTPTPNCHRSTQKGNKRKMKKLDATCSNVMKTTPSVSPTSVCNLKSFSNLKVVDETISQLVPHVMKTTPPEARQYHVEVQAEVQVKVQKPVVVEAACNPTVPGQQVPTSPEDFSIFIDYVSRIICAIAYGRCR